LASTGQPFDIIWYPALHGGQLAWASRYQIVQQTPGLMLLKDLMSNIEPDFIMANWQSTKFDQAFSNTVQKMDVGQASVNDTYGKLAQDLQGILDLSPA